MSACEDRVGRQNLSTYFSEVRQEIETALRRHLLESRTSANGYFNDALNSAIFPGGKRIRPVLTLLGAEIVGGNRTEVLSAAAAVEFVHNSSLVFDDLPCMDNASSRRGQPPLHQSFGEATAILVALNLMNAAYDVMLKSSPNVERALRAHAELVECIGPNGMLGGQSVDLMSTSSQVAPFVEDASFEKFRNRKTSSLIQLSLRVGAILVGGSQRQLDALSRFAAAVGNAYQVVDDLRDRTEDAIRTGNGNHPPPFSNPRTESCKRVVSNLIDEAKLAIEMEFGMKEHSLLLSEIADYVGYRVPEARLQSSN
ncbi:MAG: polyprenyl synthetase family protein [Pyrinomonadaceae bacterium]